MNSSIASNPAFSCAAAAEVYSHLPSVRLCGIPPVNRRTTWSWNPPRTLTTQGVTTQVYEPKYITNWITALKKNLYTYVAAPSLTRIPVNLSHTTHTLAMFLTTSGQSSSAADITCPKYLKDFTIKSGHSLYLSSIRVNLRFAVHKLEIFSSNPGKVHFEGLVH